VCFEGIEHITEHILFLTEVKKLMRQDAIFIVSTPDRKFSLDVPGHNNPFHLRELCYGDFEGLLTMYFKYVRIFGQRVFAASAIWGKMRSYCRQYREFVIDRADEEFYFTDGNKTHMYMIGVASDADLPSRVDGLYTCLFDASGGIFREYEGRIENLRRGIENIEQSASIRLLSRHQEAVNRMLPSGTIRRYFYELALFAVRVTIKEGWRGFLREFKRWLLSPLQRLK